MYLYCINIYKNNILSKSKKNLERFGFFEKKSVSEFMDFLSKELIKNSSEEIFCVNENKFKISIYKNLDYAYSIITNNEYPDRVIYQLYSNLNKNIDSYESIFETYSNQEIDKIGMINKELKETKEILTKTLDSILTRGETLDKLIEDSEELTRSSKMFYKNAKKMNSCCVIL